MPNAATSKARTTAGLRTQRGGLRTQRGGLRTRPGGLPTQRAGKAIRGGLDVMANICGRAETHVAVLLWPLDANAILRFRIVTRQNPELIEDLRY